MTDKTRILSWEELFYSWKKW